MSETDLIFAFVTLLLGLGIAEALGGVSRIVIARRTSDAKVRIGWLTPLLGLFVVLDLTSFWLLTYDFRDQFRATYPMLIGILAICGLYYLVATLVFPKDPAQWTDLDDHYDAQKRVVLGGILAANLLQAAGQMVIEILVPTPASAPKPSGMALLVDGVTALAILSLLITTMLTRSHRANAVTLSAIIAAMVVGGTIAAAF